MFKKWTQQDEVLFQGEKDSTTNELDGRVVLVHTGCYIELTTFALGKKSGDYITISESGLHKGKHEDW